MFHITAHKVVSHNDRDTEFIKLKRDILAWLHKTYGGINTTAQLGAKSCEMLATELIEEFGLIECTVSEDGENGATVVPLNIS